MSIQVHLHTNEQPRKKEREEKEEIMYIWKVYYCLFSHDDNGNTCLEKQMEHNKQRNRKKWQGKTLEKSIKEQDQIINRKGTQGERINDQKEKGAM
jgi:hypothetical protein